MTVEKINYQFEVKDTAGAIIAPRGKYIFAEKFLRKFVKVSNYVNGYVKYGLIAENGEEVLPLLFDDIWTVRKKFNNNDYLYEDHRSFRCRIASNRMKLRTAVTLRKGYKEELFKDLVI